MSTRLRVCSFPLSVAWVALAAAACSSVATAPPQRGTSESPAPIAAGRGSIAGAASGIPDAGLTTEAGEDGALGSGASGDAASDGAPSQEASPEASSGAGSDASSDAAGEGGAFVGALLEAAAPLCDPARAWSTATATPLTLTALEPVARFGGVSADEKTIAVTTSLGSIVVFDRQSPAVMFGPETVVAPGLSGLALDRVAIGSTGNVLLAVASARDTFAAFNRSTSGVWSEADPLQFQALNAATRGATSSEPVLSADGRSFFFVITPSGGPPTLVESSWDDQTRTWEAPLSHEEPELVSADASSQKRPTGASADGLTLFFYDESMRLERAAWRASREQPFTYFAAIPSLKEAAPTELCDRLYGMPTVSTQSGSPLATVP